MQTTLILLLTLIPLTTSSPTPPHHLANVDSHPIFLRPHPTPFNPSSQPTSPTHVHRISLNTTTIRQTPPCGRHQIRCWSKKALQYTNTVRANNGEKPLIHGTQSQLDNALRYAKVLASKKTLQHQTLPAVTKEVKCLRWIGGENLAFNYEKGDIARACVQQWIASRKHWDNLVRPWFEEMVVGVHIRFDGRVYCVQTFAVFFPRHSTFGTRDGPKCHQVVAP